MTPDRASRAFARLKGQRAFATMSDDQLAGLATVVDSVTTDIATVLYDEGGEDRNAYYILDGAVLIRRSSPLGPVHLASLLPGSLAGELSFLDGQPREATAVATSTGTALSIDFEPALALMHAEEAFAVAMFRILWQSLAARLRQANGAMMRIMGTRSPGVLECDPEAPVRAQPPPPEKVGALLAAGLSGEDVDLLAETMRGERFVPGQTIVAEGSAGDVLYVVAEGSARVSRRVPGMGQESLWMLRRGEVFGEVAIIDGSPRSADVIAHEDGCLLLSIKRDRLEGFLSEHPTAARQLLGLVCRTLCQRLRSMGDQLVAWHVMAGFGGS